MFGLADIYWIAINSTLSFVFLFVFSKILGKKQIAQLEFIDYAVGISLGSIAGEWAIAVEHPFYNYALSMAIFFVFALAIALIGRKTTLLKRIFKGKPVPLIYEGNLRYDGLKKCKIDVNDLLSMLREKGFFDISDVAYAIFETSGKLSVLPKGNQRPVVIEDIDKQKIKKESLTNILIVDGEISKSGLNEIDKTEEWLFQKLNLEYEMDLKNILLATYDEETQKVTAHYKQND